MKKIRTIQEGKSFEAYVKAMFLDSHDNLHGLSIAGSPMACRAIYASLYTAYAVTAFDSEHEESDTFIVQPTHAYHKVEEVDGKVCHLTALPKMADYKKYQQRLNNMSQDTDNEEYPEKVVMTWDIESHNKAVGRHLADTFGLPTKTDWLDTYLRILPSDKIERLRVYTTEIGEEYENVALTLVHSMKLQDVLEHVQNGIESGELDPVDKSSDIQADFENGWSTEDYLRANTNALVGKIDKYMKPKYDTSYVSEEIGEMNRLPVPAQAQSAMGLLSVLKEKKGAFLSGKMGSGKTQISLAASYVKARKREKSGAKDGMRILIVAPQNVLPKWKDSEIPEILGETCELKAWHLTKIQGEYCSSMNIAERRLYKKFQSSKFLVTFIENTKDADDYIKAVRSGWKVPHGKIHYVLLATDRMKYHAQGFALGARWNAYRDCWISPDSGYPLQAPDVKKKDMGDEEILAAWGDAVHSPENPPSLDEIEKARENGYLMPNGLPYGYVKSWKSKVRSFQDDYAVQTKTNRVLDRPKTSALDKGASNHRWMIAEMFQRKIPHHFHLGIFDEIHQMKGSGTGRGLAFHKITKAVRKGMFLTGTLTNGASSSIQAVLWRIFPHELLAHGFDHNTSEFAWAKQYGVLEREVKNYADTKTGVLTNKKTVPKYREKPGISPKLVARHLLDKSVFIDLHDLGIPMITLEEKPIIVDLDEEHQEEYDKFASSIYEKSKSYQWEIGQAAWSRYVPSVQNYVDQPSLPLEVPYIDKDGEVFDTVYNNPFDKEYESAKERKLVDLVKERVNQERGTVIYTQYTQGYQTNRHLQKLLQKHGVNPVILDDNIKPNQRFDWIEKQSENGTKVIITNQSLVEVGLDLYAFPTIIFWQMNDNINTVRQSSKRAHRMGQNRHCEVLYLVADRTYQMEQFQRLMSRRVSALLVEGAIESSDEIAKYADVGVSQITNDLSKSLSKSEIESAWGKIAEKEFDDDMELVSEDELQKRIAEAFKSLTNDTLKLCGLKPDPFLNDWENDQVGSMIDEMFDGVFENEDSTGNQSKLDVIIEPDPLSAEEDTPEEENDDWTEQLSLF